MTMTSLNSGWMAWPGHCEMIDAAPSITTDQTITAANTYQAWIGAAREAMTISHIGFRINSVSGAPTAEVRVETVDTTTGLPTGTLWAANTNGTSGTLTATTWFLVALTAPASIAAGQVFAIVVKYASGTNFVLLKIGGYRNTRLNLPYEAPNGVRGRMLGGKCMAVASSTTTFYQLNSMLPAINQTNTAFNNTSSAAQGMRFQVPVKCRVIGIRHYQGTANGDYNAVIYDDSGTELSSSSTAYDGNYSAESAGGVHYSFLDNPVTLSAGTWYRAALEPSSATNINISTVQLPTLDYRSAWPGGTNQLYTTRASGTWTDTATDKIPLMDILIDQVDDGTGSGGATPIGIIGG